MASPVLSFRVEEGLAIITVLDQNLETLRIASTR
ncbi:UNVERIFIED_ORG: hypothetical protein J2Y77_000068 [Pseudomonas lini]